MRPNFVQQHELFVFCFFGTGAVFALIMMVFLKRAGVAAKRRWTPRLVALATVLFGIFAAAMMVLDGREWSNLWSLPFVAPFLAVYAWLINRSIRFCDQCGANLFDQNWFKPMRFCPRCGAALEGKPSPVPDDEIA